MTVRTRFAPSPTGELHLGNARIAVLNWLYARHADGRFVLRIEDTDPQRNVPGAEQRIMDSLRRLGLRWDEGPDTGGAFGPYRQSERTNLYRETAERLLEQGSAFRCYCSEETLADKREAALARGDRPIYDGTCRDLGPADERRYAAEGIAPSVRFRVAEQTVEVEDLVRGRIAFDSREFGDFVILKSDGSPTYNFAVVADDHAMRISHVIRGVGHLANTPRQVMIYRALELEPPVFVHVPHVLAPQAKAEETDGAGMETAGALSKRGGARSLAGYLDAGYMPEALVNYLSLLSWSSPTGEEILPVERLVEEIDLTRIGASDVMLDEEKLKWLSGTYIRRLEPAELAERLAAFLGPDRIPAPEHRTRVASAIQERIDTLAEAEDFLPQFFPPEPMSWTEEALAAIRSDRAAALFAALRSRLEAVDPWSGAAAIEAVRAAGREVGLKGRDLFMPVRAAVTGATRGPELPDIFDVQGRETALRVIEEAERVARGAAPPAVRTSSASTDGHHRDGA